MFSSRQYNQIADVIKDVENDIDIDGELCCALTMARLISKLSDMFEIDNPEFDRRKFDKRSTSTIIRQKRMR